MSKKTHKRNFRKVVAADFQNLPKRLNLNFSTAAGVVGALTTACMVMGWVYIRAAYDIVSASNQSGQALISYGGEILILYAYIVAVPALIATRDVSCKRLKHELALYALSLTCLNYMELPNLSWTKAVAVVSLYFLGSFAAYTAKRFYTARAGREIFAPKSLLPQILWLAVTLLYWEPTVLGLIKQQSEQAKKEKTPAACSDRNPGRPPFENRI